LAYRPRRNGPKPRLSPEQEAVVSEWVEQGPELARDGVVRWRCVDLQGRIERDWGISLHERTIMHPRQSCCLSGVTRMNLNHVNLVVTDVAASRAFIENHFGFRCIVEKGADTFVGFANKGGMTLLLSNFDHVDDFTCPHLFHIGFFIESDEAVNAPFERFRADGLEVGERKNFHGAWTFYLKAPGGLTVELAHQGEKFN